MTQLKLEKVLQEDLELFKIAINHYSGTLQFLLETMEDKKYAKDLSISIELWYELNKKTILQHPPEKSKVKLSLHKAYVLLDALKNYSSSANTSEYERSRCTRFYMAIDQQLPSTTQLVIQK